MGAISPFPTVETCLTWIKACVTNIRITQISLFLLFSLLKIDSCHIQYILILSSPLYSSQFFPTYFPQQNHSISLSY